MTKTLNDLVASSMSRTAVCVCGLEMAAISTEGRHEGWTCSCRVPMVAEETIVHGKLTYQQTIRALLNDCSTVEEVVRRTAEFNSLRLGDDCGHEFEQGVLLAVSDLGLGDTTVPTLFALVAKKTCKHCGTLAANEKFQLIGPYHGRISDVAAWLDSVDAMVRYVDGVLSARTRALGEKDLDSDSEERFMRDQDILWLHMGESERETASSMLARAIVGLTAEIDPTRVLH